MRTVSTGPEALRTRLNEGVNGGARGNDCDLPWPAVSRTFKKLTRSSTINCFLKPSSIVGSYVCVVPAQHPQCDIRTTLPL
jgi:hypothetical protein